LEKENQIIDDINTLWKDFVNIKAYFPYIPKDSIGIQSYTSPDFYKQFNVKIDFRFSKALKENDIEQINHFGHWISQNVLIRLTALLEQNEIICGESSIRHDFNESEKIRLLIQLRNKFAHSKGEYNSKKCRNKKLMNDIIKTFNLDEIEYSNYPIPIDEVIEPIFEGSKKYVLQWLKI
jgi:hypothetical protein